jgi:hypothetical protein
MQKKTFIYHKVKVLIRESNLYIIKVKSKDNLPSHINRKINSLKN